MTEASGLAALVGRLVTLGGESDGLWGLSSLARALDGFRGGVDTAQEPGGD